MAEVAAFVKLSNELLTYLTQKATPLKSADFKKS